MHKRSRGLLPEALVLTPIILLLGMSMVAHAQSSGGQLPQCPSEASGVGGANTSSSNAAASSNAECKKGPQEGYYSGKPYQWKCVSKDGKTMTNKLDAPCSYSGKGGSVQGKCSANSECKASNPEGQPPQMPQMPKGGGGGGGPQQQQPPQQDQASSTQDCLGGLADTSPNGWLLGSSTRDCLGKLASTSLDAWRLGSSTDDMSSTSHDFAAASEFEFNSGQQNGSNHGSNSIRNWTGLNFWNAWTGAGGQGDTSNTSSDTNTEGTAGSADQARINGSNGSFQQNTGFSHWSSIFNDLPNQLHGGDDQSLAYSGTTSGGSYGSDGQGRGAVTGGLSGTGQESPSSGTMGDNTRAEFQQYGASVSFREDSVGSGYVPPRSIFQRAYHSIVDSILGLVSSVSGGQ